MTEKVLRCGRCLEPVDPNKVSSGESDHLPRSSIEWTLGVPYEITLEGGIHCDCDFLIIHRLSENKYRVPGWHFTQLYFYMG